MIRLLPQTLINQIAAGEVVERPASALKELIENSIDAHATQIDIKIIDGGKSYFSVTDNGKGMTKEELNLCVERHATSKLPTEDLFNINFLGFRGEAIPSIASVSHLTITSRTKESDSAWQIQVDAGKKSDVHPAAHGFGTTVEVKDLFYATPARLKFLKSNQTEAAAVKEVINRLAIAYPDVGFSVSDERKKVLSYSATNDHLKRINAVIGHAFSENVLPINIKRDNISLIGFIGLPTYTRATSAEQYLFVNGRCIKDKLMTGVIRAGYQGFIGHDTFPVAVLFLKVPNEEVDVNVHPAKTEVRFKNSALIKGIIVGSIRNLLSEQGNKTSSTISLEALSKSIPSSTPSSASFSKGKVSYRGSSKAYSNSKLVSPSMPEFSIGPSIFSVRVDEQKEEEVQPQMPLLGFAKAQLHKTYIVSQAEDGIVITDQHAAHERLTYEKLIASSSTPQSQVLLIPEIINLSYHDTQCITPRFKELKEFGLIIDSFGENCIIVREIPAILEKADIKKLIQDLIDTLKEYDDTVLLKDKFKEIYARMACHTSIRAGRVLTIDEMNALLRQMESCGTSGQCIHGRPTYIKLNLNDIEKLFGRKE